VYITRLHVYTRASLTDILARILARKSARVVEVGGQVGEDRHACPARGKLNGEVAGQRTRRHPRDDPRREIGEDVRVGVGPMEFQLIQSTSPVSSRSLVLSSEHVVGAETGGCGGDRGDGRRRRVVVVCRQSVRRLTGTTSRRQLISCLQSDGRHALCRQLHAHSCIQHTVLGCMRHIARSDDETKNAPVKKPNNDH